jgi:presenilin-like A22 family membrane protease
MRWLIPFIYVLTALTAVVISPTYESAGMKVFENPEDVMNSVYYFIAILAFTVVIIVLAKKSLNVLKFMMYLLLFITAYYVFYPLAGILSFLIALIVVLVLIKKPNTIVLNLSAFVIACGITAMFGISLEPLPVLVLLAVLAVYDAIAVYKTKHMIDLADSVVKLNLPLLFIIPTKDNKPILLGVGDVVIPNILVVSAQVFSNSTKIVMFKLPAITTLIGGFLGLITLLIVAERCKKPHAGLPFLNTGAIIGYIVGCCIL